MTVRISLALLLALGASAPILAQAPTTPPAAATAQEDKALLAFLDQAFDQHFDLAATAFLAVQASLDDARIVKDQQVPLAQQAGQVGELAVMQLAGTVQMQQTAALALGRRALSDQIRGKLVIELGDS